MKKYKKKVMMSNMNILGIDTSCDDTSIAVLEAKGGRKASFKVLSSIISSQTKIHRPYGGVYPYLAKREHQRNLVPVLKEALLKARLLKSKIKNQKQKTENKKVKEILRQEDFLCIKLEEFLGKYQKSKIDLIAVTVGPGLEPCLWQGVNFAKALACFWKIPIAAVNHIEAHILVNFLGSNSDLKTLPCTAPPLAGPVRGQKSKPQLKDKKIFPAIALVVSGGHTQLILMRRPKKYRILGETRDDAAGECFDKTARIMNLGYPGGPAIAEYAAKSNSQSQKIKTKLPRPMIYSQDYDFSFSGLKTAVLYDYRKRNKNLQKSKEYLSALAKETQQSIIDILIKKTIRAARTYKVSTIILGGGVAANEELRQQFTARLLALNSKMNLLVPPKILCTDNGAMVAVAGYYSQKKDKTKDWLKIRVKANLRLA